MGDFRHLSDSLVHRGYVWDVVVAEFEGPDGTTFTRDVVRSPGAVAVVPVHRRGAELCVTLVHQYRAPLDRRVLEIPAGMRDVAGEPPMETAARELAEEVGLTASTWVELTRFSPSVGMTDAELHVFLATDLVPVGRSAHGPEESHMDIIEMTLDEAIGLISSGSIHDAKSIIGLLLADRHLR
ncbi:MAG: NUDIX domain-containing protein [Ilumatobacteraceae bacterium]